MRNLNPLPLVWAAKTFELSNLCREPRKGRLANYRPAMVSRYWEYHRNKSELSQIALSTVTGVLCTDLKYLYTSDKLPLQELKAEIRRIQDVRFGSLCQYCGIDQVSSHDHYVPKDDYPEFSVLPINLIPCCRVCNQRKDEYWKGQNGRTIINLYFDQLPAVRYLYSEIVAAPGRAAFAVFYLDLDPQINPGTSRLISEHFRILRLLESYREQSGQTIALARTIIHATLGPLQNNDTAIRNQLLKIAASHRDQYGINYWKSALFDALAVYPQLMY